MVPSLECLVDKHHGSDPYFQTAAEPPKTDSAFKRGAWPARKITPNRIVDDLHQRTHDDPSPLGDLNRVYPHAVEMGKVGLSRVIWVGFTLFGLGFAAFVGFMLQNLATDNVFPFGAVVMGFVFLGPVFVFLLMLAWLSCRLAVWGARDEPVLFNRKTRQVHALISVAPSFWKFWDLGRDSRLITYPWDRVKVRSYAYLASGGGGLTTKSFLCLLWDTPEAPRTLVDFVQLGSKGGWVDDPHYRQWEYIRRYMEEDGPVLPTDNTLNPGYNKRPNMFPSAIVEAAGGTPYTPEQIRELVNEYKATVETADAEAVRQA